jgi:hypothetical protein
MKPWAAVLAVALAGCGGPKEAKIGEARLAYADGVDPLPADAPTVELTPGKTPALPAGPVAVLAIDRDTTFDEIAPVIEHARAAGTKLWFAVGDQRQRLKAMEADAPGDETAIRVVITNDGKACISLPGVEEGKCVLTAQRRVDRSYVRELVREAFKASELRYVRVEAETGLRWSDVVRAVDGARTCCKGERLDVRLERL